METTCSEINCNRKVRSRGRCNTHYEYWRRNNRDLVKPTSGKWNNPDGTRMTCQYPDCKFDVLTQGLCSHHYQNFHYETTRGATKTKKNRKMTPYGSSERLILTCTFEGCDNIEFNPGLCAGHYAQKFKGYELVPLHEQRECPVKGCGNLYFSSKTKKGLCAQHIALAKKYSISREKLITLFENPICSNPGCSRTERLSIDHDHSCCNRRGSCGDCVRGLLCHGCNSALGMLQENPRRIEGLLEYLESFKR